MLQYLYKWKKKALHKMNDEKKYSKYFKICIQPTTICEDDKIFGYL